MPQLEAVGFLAWLIPAVTALAFVAIVGLIMAGGQGRWAGWIGVAAMLVSMVLGLVVFLAALGRGGEELAKDPYFQHVAWAPIGESILSFGIMIDPLGAVTVAMVTVVCAMIFIYSTAYMHGEHTAYRDPQTGAVDHHTGSARYARFFAYISLFATGMLGFVLSSNMLQAMIFWEIMGLCSFLLIGFWYHKPAAAAAAKKAFLTTRIGDLFFFVGILLLYGLFGTVDYQTILAPPALEALNRMAPVGIGAFMLPMATVIALFIFGGAVGKSAQFPLHVWLPDAMEGPTPVSALIHAATMVAAGVFLVARTYPLFVAGAIDEPGQMTGPLATVALIGAITALMAATIGVAQFDIKRVLAFSTISQLGYMIMALGIGAYVAAVFHLITHAFFKALLFLGSGSVIHGVEHGLHHAEAHPTGDGHAEASPAAGAAAPGVAGAVAGVDAHDPQDMRNMGGLRRRMPLTFWTFLLGTLALTGIPPLAGFWSKDEILAEAFHKGLLQGLPIAGLVWLAGTLAAFLTALYMARQVFMVFFGPPQTEGARHAPESSPAMVYPLVVLAFFAVVIGFIGVPAALLPMLDNPFHRFVGVLPLHGSHFEAVPFSIAPMLLSILMVALGWALGWRLYGRDPAAARARDPLRRLGGLWTLLHRKYYFDEIYAATVVRFSLYFTQLNALIDSRLVDGLVNLAGRAGIWLGDANGWIDNRVVDGTVNLVGYVTNELAHGFRLIQSGRVQQYLLVVFFGLLVLVGMFLF
jgi:NADH-quinone oxidoreductase subunit L